MARPSFVFLRRPAAVCIAVLAALAAACSSDSPSDPGDGGGDTPSISITLGSTVITLQQGANGTVTVNLTRAGGFSGAVTLAVDGLPSGITATGGQIAAGAASGSVSLAAAAGATVGSATATIRATAAGVAAATASLGIQITPAPTGGFSLSTSPSALSIQQGASGQTTLSVARTAPFTGAVQVSASAPAGVTVTGLGSAIAGGDAAVGVAVGSGVAPGSYSITFTGSASGVADAGTTLDLTVTAAPAGSDFTWGFCDDVPVWLAVKDGAGDWTQVVGAGGQFSFTVTSDRVGVAAVWDAGGGEFETTVWYLGRAEASLYIGTCPTYRTVNGTVVGLGLGQLANITLSHDATTLVGGTGTTFTFDRVMAGANDFFASLVDASGGVPTLQTMFFQRDVDPGPGGSVTVDFTGPDAFAPTTINVSASNLGTDVAATAASLLTPTMGASIITGALPTGGPTWSVPVVPQGRLRAGDLMSVAVTAVASVSDPSRSRATVKYFSTVADQNLSLGPFLGTVAVTVPSTAPYARFRVQYTRQAEYMGHVLLSFGQPTRDVSMWITDDWLGAATDLDVTFPDFSSVPGWLDLWGPLAGVSATWVVNANGWDGLPGIIGPGSFVDGLEVRSGIRFGTIVP